jgi:molecular chaperone DnaJ
MSDKRDFYEVLGVGKQAGADDIRKAYRQCALKFHPDRNPGDATAEAKFKEATEAFQILSDDDKRAKYDRFGHAAFEGGGGADPGADIFSHFQDIFSEFFGGGGPRRGGGRRSGGPQRGSDVRVHQRLSLKESMTGCKREVALRTPVPCETCEGSGAKPGTKRKTCGACGGAGQVSTSRGFVMFTQTCPECQGEGSVVKSACDACHGAGQVEKQRKVVVTFPAGIDSGQRLRVPNQGIPGTSGAPSGDLFVDVEVLPEPGFERDGLDLVTKLTLTIAEAALGVTREVPLPDETSVPVDFPKGTQPGEVVTTRNRGIPRIDGRGKGNLHVIAQVGIPKTLSAKAEELLRALDAELRESAEG